MYGIPATHIISDDSATCIRVQDDNIIAPPLDNPENQTKPIIQAVGSVLDYISQRIDDKLDEYQMNNIQQGRLDEEKPILPGKSVSSALSYFNDEDDITNDVDMDASANDAAGVVNTEENNVADQIQESAYHVNMVSKFNNTRHLGYDLLQKHGFDFVKPIDSFVMESKSDDEPKPVNVGDIKYFKFDNTGILNAVKYFNKARAAQSNVKNDAMDLDKFINDPNYEKAIDSLNKQFDCRINLRFFKAKGGGNAGTWIMNDLKKKLTISKSKGFQLGGLPIDIAVYNHYFEKSSPNEQDLFGQNTVSTICHEIFHNIACVLRDNNAKMSMSLAMTMDAASNAKTAKERRIIITNYVDSLGEMTENKFINKAMKKKLIKHLAILASVKGNEKALNELKKDDKGKTKESSDKYIDKAIKTYKKAIRRVGGTSKQRRNSYIFSMVASAAEIIAGVCTLSSPIGFFLLGAGGISLGILSAMGLTEYSVTKHYKNSRQFEEYYCDLFAAMYKLPKFFFIGSSSKKYVANDFDKDKLNELAKLEKDFYEAIFCSYPSDLERTHAGVKVAKKLLEQKDLDPAFRKYCQWIVDNFSSVQDTDIETIYNTTTFDPKEAEDLDKHLGDLINDNNIVLTESFRVWMNKEDEIL